MTRLELRRAVQEQLEQCDFVLAMWESGSAAFDRADEYSDLDIGLLVRTGTLERTWAAVDQAMEKIGGFDLRWQVPGHIFKGMTQRFYHPRNAGPWLLLDIGVFEETAEHFYLDEPRHGRAEVLFDRTGRIKPPAWDEQKHLREMREALHQEIGKWHAVHAFCIKELKRGRTIDAFGFYVGLVMRPLLNVLGMLHRPQRWDYGFRYAREDLPAEVVARLEQLCYVAEPALLERRFAEAEQMFQEAVGALKRAGMTPIDSKGIDVVPVDGG